MPVSGDTYMITSAVGATMAEAGMLPNTPKRTGQPHNEELSSPSCQCCQGSNLTSSPQAACQTPCKVPRTLQKSSSVLSTKAFMTDKDNEDRQELELLRGDSLWMGPLTVSSVKTYQRGHLSFPHWTRSSVAFMVTPTYHLS